MGLRLDRPMVRILGLLSGVGYGVVGIAAMTAPAELIVSGHDRVFWFGITATVIGAIAVAASLFARDLDNIWCRHPARWSRRQGTPRAGDGTSQGRT